MASNKLSAAGGERRNTKGATVISLAVAALLGCYLLLTSTTRLIPAIELYDAKRILQLGLLLAVTLVPLASTEIRGRVAAFVASTPVVLRWCLLLAFAWAAVSAAWHAESGLHLANSLSDVVLPMLLVACVFVVAACRQTAGTGFDRIAISLLALTGIAVGIQELTGVLAAHAAGTDFNYWLALVYFAHPRFFNQVQTWIVLALPALPLLFPRSRLAVLLCLLALTLNWFVVLMTGARGTSIAVVTATIAIVALVPTVRGYLLKWQLGGLIGGAAMFALVSLSFQPDPGAATTSAAAQSPPAPIGEDAASSTYIGDLPSAGSRFLSSSVGRPLLHSMGRIAMWERTARDAWTNPVFGIGPMAYPCSQAVRFAHPHNYPLQIAAEWGLPAALVLCLFAAIVLCRTLSALRRTPERGFKMPRISALLAGGTVAAILHTCVSGVLIMPASQAAGLLVCGMLLGQVRCNPGPERRRPGRLFFVPAVMLSAALLMLGLHELRTMQQRTDLMPPGVKHPRMWQDAFTCRFYTSQIPVTN